MSLGGRDLSAATTHGSVLASRYLETRSFWATSALVCTSLLSFELEVEIEVEIVVVPLLRMLKDRRTDS